MIGTVKLPQNAWGVNTPALSEKSVFVYSFNYNGSKSLKIYFPRIKKKKKATKKSNPFM
jgi:hypothetical protein